jgi:hypothetical protein
MFGLERLGPSGQEIRQADHPDKLPIKPALDDREARQSRLRHAVHHGA